MKATFQNIGPIKKAELELGDLTIIAGQNNTGKTYLAYTLYGFLRSITSNDYDIISEDKKQKSFSHVNHIAKTLAKHGKVSIDFVEYRELLNLMLLDMSTIFSSEDIGPIFSASNNEFENAKFHLEIDMWKPEFIKSGGRIRSENGAISLSVFISPTQIKFKIENYLNIEIIMDNIRWVILRLAMGMALKMLNPFILSSERFSIPLFYKELDFAKNRIVEEWQKKSNDSDFDASEFIRSRGARYAKPIKDNIDFTRDIGVRSNETMASRLDVVKRVEEIVGGYYKASESEVRFISNKRGDYKFNIPLHLASSSARGISDLYFYLKTQGNQSNFLIIDEPESHLSPGNQVLMARLLVFCVNSGIRVLITTHSDFLIKEINNLIILHGNFHHKADFLKKNKNEYTKEYHLDQTRVKAYICENGGLMPCSIDDMGMDMPVFDDAIDKINRISNELFLLKESG